MYGDIVVGELPIDFVPFDSNVLSLELPGAFKVSRQAEQVACKQLLDKLCTRSITVQCISVVAVLCTRLRCIHNFYAAT